MTSLQEKIGYKIGELLYHIEKSVRSLRGHDLQLGLFECVIYTPRNGIESIKHHYPKLFEGSNPVTEQLVGLGEIPESLSLVEQNAAWMGHSHAEHRDLNGARNK